MFSEIFNYVFSKIQKKEPVVENQITLKCFELEMKSIQCLAEKQVVNKDQNQSIFTHLCY